MGPQLRRPGRVLLTATTAMVLGAATVVLAPSAWAASTCGGLRATIVGTNGGDSLQGTAGRDVIAGRGGSDFIDGGGGDDVVCGGGGRDQLYGSDGQ